MINEKPQVNFPALTGIRAIAVYLVYLHHTNPFSTERFGNFVHSFIAQFHIGVNIFFVLSGFLITLRYYESSRLTEPWLRKYFQNRIARVYPMYFILTTLTFIIFFIQGHQDNNPLFIYLMNITFLKGFFDDLKFTLIAQGWSLTVEECFYIMAPLLFIGFRKNKWSLLLYTATIIAFGCGLVVVFSDINFYGLFNSYSFLFTYTFFGRCTEFLIGAGIVILFRSTLHEEKRGILFTLLGLILSATLVGVLAVLTMVDNNGLNSMEKIIVSNFLLPAAIAILFYGLIREKSALQTILSSQPFVLLGKASYTFYLIHIGVFYTLINGYFPNNYLLTFLLLNLIALALWYTIEEPLNKLIRKA
jgi:peptidoglycan/LPS O-acetylase OafA/YrhL